MTNTPNYWKMFHTPRQAKQPQSRKVWSIDLERVLVPYFKSANAVGDTAIPSEALGAPLQLAYDKTGAVRFTPSGRPAYRVAKEINDEVRLMRENLIAGLIDRTAENIQSNPDGYKAQVALAQKAGEPIKAHDKREESNALKARAEAEAAAIAKAAADAEAVKAEAVAEAVTLTEAKPKKSKELVHA